jgi:signal transduction histidine kinase
MGINVYYYKHLLAFSLERERFEFISYSDPQSRTLNRSILKGALSRDGKIWVVTYSKSDSIVERIELYDGKEFKPVVNFPEDYVIQCLLEDKDGGLWIGSSSHDRGLGLLKDGEFKQFGPEDGYQCGGVFDICQLADGRILVTGRDALYAYDGTHWELVRKGLDVTFAVKEGQGGDLWVSSGTGLHRCHDDCWITYTAEDGLPNTASSSVLQDSRGRVWAGTIHGLSLFHPEADTDPPKTLINQRDNQRDVSPRGEARLQFSGVDKWNYTRPGRLLFSYRLDDAEWSPFKTGNAAWFDGLSFGPHRFEVRAMDVNLNIDPYPSTFEFTVLMPWYRETAFQIMAGIGGSIIFLLLGYAVHRHLVLERLVRERTENLHTQYQARLEAEKKQTEAVKIAEKASRLASIGVMAAGITHEINQPLNTMRILSEGALIDYEQDSIVSTPEEYLGMIRKIFFQILRINKIVEHMKEFWITPAKIEQELCNLNDAVSGALSLIETQIRSHGIDLHLSLGHQLPPIRGNRIHLEQIVINLTVNAVHALDQVDNQEKEITIITSERDARVILEVSDNGRGFAKGDEEKIFDAFYSTKEPGQGAGLGLAIVLKFVESLNGNILACNDKDGGARFILDFPPVKR